MNRFLRYSLEKQKKIRAVIVDESGALKQLNIQVTRLSEESFSFISTKHKNPVCLPVTALLSAGYSRGDSGEM